MTHITIYKSFNDIVGFRTEGHAGYAVDGNDIVCAAVSMLTINTINSLEQFTEDELNVTADEDNALIECIVTSSTISIQAQVLLKALELGITQTAADNPDYLSITVKEV